MDQRGIKPTTVMGHCYTTKFTSTLEALDVTKKTPIPFTSNAKATYRDGDSACISPNSASTCFCFLCSELQRKRGL